MAPIAAIRHRAAVPDGVGAISVGGGLLGITFGYFLDWLIARTAEWKTIGTTASVVIAFGVPVVVGAVFAIYPAVKASRINPIDAPRYE
jgi:putative ABC transport system permease protein